MLQIYRRISKLKKFYINKNYSYYNNDTDENISISSVLGLIGENSSINSFCSNTNKTFIIDNSLFNADKNCKINNLIALNNSLVNIQQENVTGYIDKNSFLNFPRIFNDITYKIGGCIYSHIQNEYYSWSSKLALSGTNKLYWMKKNQYSRYILNENIIDNITIDDSNKLIDFFNETDILYKNELVGGNFKQVKFILANNIKSNVNLLGFDLFNNKNYYTIENNSNKTLKFTNINIKNIEKFKALHISFNNLNIEYSNIYLYNKSNVDNLSAFNSNIYVQTMITNFQNIFSTNIINENNEDKLVFEKREYNKDVYNSNTSILNNEDYSSLNTYPQKGNKIITKETNAITNRNNSYRYGLQSHTHKSFISINDNSVNGLIFPIQYNTTNENISNTNYKQLYKNNGVIAYQPLSSTYRNTHIQQLVNLPIGSIIQYYQLNIDDEWRPKVPYGFYQLKDKSYNVVADTDDCNSITYNALLVKTLGINADNMIILPIGNIIYNKNNTCRIIQIIKYSELIKERK